MDATKPVHLLFGEVISVSPLKIQVDQKSIYTEKMLVLTRNVTDFEVDMSVSHITEKRAGDSVELTGPAGVGFPVEELKGKIAVVSGGIGIAPLLLAVKNLSGCQVVLCCGFRDKSYCLDAFRPYVGEIRIATDSGREGQKGFVTELLDPADFDAVITCGPEPMMEKLARACMAKKVPCYVSMERHMACGIGACLGCTHHTAHGAKCICKDGPVFKGEDIYA